jgi:hypothetical protein
LALWDANREHSLKEKKRRKKCFAEVKAERNAGKREGLDSVNISVLSNAAHCFKARVQAVSSYTTNAGKN